MNAGVVVRAMVVCVVLGAMLVGTGCAAGLQDGAWANAEAVVPEALFSKAQRSASDQWIESSMVSFVSAHSDGALTQGQRQMLDACAGADCAAFAQMMKGQGKEKVAAFFWFKACRDGVGVACRHLADDAARQGAQSHGPLALRACALAPDGPFCVQWADFYLGTKRTDDDLIELAQFFLESRCHAGDLDACQSLARWTQKEVASAW